MTSTLLMPKYKKYLFVNLNESLTSDQLSAIKETYELGDSLPIENPVKDFMPVSEGFAEVIINSLLTKSASKKSNIPNLAKVLSRIKTDHDSQSQIILINSQEYKEILTSYLSDIKNLVKTLATQCKELMAEYASISSLNSEAKKISESLGSIQ